MPDYHIAHYINPHIAQPLLGHRSKERHHV